MNVTKVTVIERRIGTDAVFLRSDLPNACYPFDGELEVRFDTLCGTGRMYASRHFPNVPLEVIREEKRGE